MFFSCLHDACKMFAGFFLWIIILLLHLRCTYILFNFLIVLNMSEERVVKRALFVFVSCCITTNNNFFKKKFQKNLEFT